MAFPPERITVKRHRDEDPVDALYIEPKRNRPSALWKRADEGEREPQFAQALGLPGSQSNAPTLTSIVPKVTTPTAAQPALVDLPTGRTESKPQLRQHVQPNHQELARMGTKSPASLITRSSRHREGNKEPEGAGPKPRNFHLSKDSLPKIPPSAVSKRREHTQTNLRKDDLAMFIEKKEEASQSKQANKNIAAKFGASTQHDINSDQNATHSVSPRKRPGVTAEERKWRATNWGRVVEPKIHAEIATESAPTIKPLKNWDTASPELAEQLQQIAVDEILSEGARAAPENGHIQLKSQPKPPKPRHAKSQGAVDAGVIDVDMTDSNVLEDDSMYVVDTYIRSIAQPTTTEDCDMNDDPLRGLEQGNVGILVIDEDEEGLWEMYGEIQESDPEWNSEEEDENAEDYYGNDYPEDEVNSDDEFGRGAYNYRHGASDDEEFGEEMTSWSDVEEDGRTPLSTY